MEALLVPKIRSYRAFKHPWVGYPTQPPDIYAEAIPLDNGLVTDIYISWNGDTRTAKWEFSEIDEDGDVHLLGSVKRQGFETRFETHSFPERVIAEAIDSDGNRLAKSNVFHTAGPRDLENGGWSAEDLLAGQDDDPLASQDGEVYDESTSHFSFSSTTFALGLAFGAAIVAMIMVSARLCKGPASLLLQRRREAKYTPLQQDSDELTEFK